MHSYKFYPFLVQGPVLFQLAIWNKKNRKAKVASISIGFFFHASLLVSKFFIWLDLKFLEML